MNFAVSRDLSDHEEAGQIGRGPESTTDDAALCWREYVLTVAPYDAETPGYYAAVDVMYDPRSPAYNPELGGGYAPPYEPEAFRTSTATP